MPTYLYRTIPDRPDVPVEHFEVRQSMMDPPLTTHPKTGEPVRRVVTGGYGLMKVRSGGPISPQQLVQSGGDCCPGCH